MKKKTSTKQNLWAVVIAIILGILAGSMLHHYDQVSIAPLISIADVGGALFLNALMLVVAPLVTSSIIVGMSSIGSDQDFASIGKKTFGFYLGTTLLAVIVGVVFVNLMQPGIHYSGYVNGEGSLSHPEALSGFASDHNFWLNIREIIISIVPSNIFKALAENQMLGLILFSLLFGFAVSQIENSKRLVVENFFKGIFASILKLTQMIMKALPLGVFLLVFNEFVKTGISALFSVAWFVATVVAALLVYSCIVLPVLLFVIAKVKPQWHFKAMMPAIITAFSTSSSSATLPITMECVEKRAKVSNKITSLVVPLGTSLNMAGSALYESVAALFIAQVYGVEISLASQFLLILLALFTSIGIAGVPSASLVVIIIILKTMGLPTEAVGLVIAVDRFLDMCRTTVNVFSDSCCAILVAKMTGEKAVLSIDPAIVKED